MNGYRFYADLSGTRGLALNDDKPIQQLKILAEHGFYVNCIAVNIHTMRRLASLHFDPNSDKIGYVRVTPDYRYRIPEKIARKLHPRLFERLDAMS